MSIDVRDFVIYLHASVNQICSDKRLKLDGELDVWNKEELEIARTKQMSMRLTNGKKRAFAPADDAELDKLLEEAEVLLKRQKNTKTNSVSEFFKSPEKYINLATRGGGSPKTSSKRNNENEDPQRIEKLR